MDLSDRPCHPERQEQLQRLGETLAAARRAGALDSESSENSIKAEERRLTRAQLTALERGVPQPGAGLKPGFGAPKSATLSSASASADGGGGMG